MKHGTGARRVSNRESRRLELLGIYCDMELVNVGQPWVEHRIATKEEAGHWVVFTRRDFFSKEFCYKNIGERDAELNRALLYCEAVFDCKMKKSPFGGYVPVAAMARFKKPRKQRNAKV